MTNDGNGSTMTTFSGHRFVPTQNPPDMAKVEIEDIAHGLSLLCRGSGQLRYFYSVGLHCLNCEVEAEARGYSTRLRLACLLHDASEAYLSDIITPVKDHLPDYLQLEDRLQSAIYVKYLGSDLTADEFAMIDDIDKAMLTPELTLRALTAKPYRSASKLHSTPDLAEHRFGYVEQAYLKKFQELTANRM
ncbi:MAG: hypothetical protein FWG25_00455 [Promicromonosporaceae bacterium]|nr:hypothetical protein [Promicromonosporaceae bacterium]